MGYFVTMVGAQVVKEVVDAIEVVEAEHNNDEEDCGVEPLD